jgi:hypothetical protein
MPLGYEVFAGNRRDPATVEEVAETTECCCGKADRRWGMESGIAAQENIELLKHDNRRCMSVLKNALKTV